jgi:ribonuclease HI
MRAARAIQDDPAEVKIFTDGSGYEGGIGASAILMRRGHPTRTVRLHLGPDKHHIVYGGEVVGLILGAHLLNTETRPYDSVMFGTDNQAVIRALKLIKPAPGHALVDSFLTTISHIKENRGDFECRIRWSPGHHGIEGNEMADTEAKKAAEGSSSPKRALPQALHNRIPHSKSAIKANFEKKVRKKAKRHWEKSPCHNRTKKLDQNLPVKEIP